MSVLSLEEHRNRKSPKVTVDPSRILHRIYRLLERDTFYVSLEFLQDERHGEMEADPPGTYHREAEVALDPRRPILPALIHEALHYLYPELPEYRICNLEKQVVNALSERQFKNLLWKLNEAILG